MYFCTIAKSHIRLIEIAVKADKQGEGIGKKVLYRLLTRMKASGIYKLTFRTPMKENAKDFWRHIGAQIVDINGDDYEMELIIKK